MNYYIYIIYIYMYKTYKNTKEKSGRFTKHKYDIKNEKVSQQH